MGTMNLVGSKRLFLKYLEEELGRSAKTIENYDRYLTRFLAFSKVQKPQEITPKLVAKFRLYLDQQPGLEAGSMKSHTQNYYLIALRSFLKYLNQRGVVCLLPTQIELTSVTKMSPGLVSRTELIKLLAFPPKKTLEGRRDLAIIEVLFSTGLLVSELCRLSIKDVDLVRGLISVRGKGSKARLVSISIQAKQAIKNYLKIRNDKKEALFIRYGKKAHVGTEVNISPRTVQRLLRYYTAKAGVVDKVTPQTIRNSFAVNVLDTGIDPHKVQAILGHANISTTKIYTKTKRP